MTKPPLHRHRPSLDLGPLPVDLIWRTLALELDAGNVVFSAGAQIHAERRHPAEYRQFLPMVKDVIHSPLYLGDDFRNPGKIEFIRNLPSLTGGLLVAVEIIKDRHGTYNVCSMYTITQSQIDKRRQKGFLKPCH